MTFIPVILCGGSGSRLFPLSRSNFPKQFIKVNNELSLLQNTIVRFEKNSNIILVSNLNHKYILIGQILELIKNNTINPNIKFTIFLESHSRNTLPAISIVCKYFINSKLLFIPCDHIYNTKTLLDSIDIGVKSENPIVTFGIKPIYPETGFGYINVDMADMFVNKFIEKPSLEKATILISEENNYWNSGIYLLESNNFYELVKKIRPDTFNIINNLEISIQNDNNLSFYNINDNYSKCENISIDFGIMELLEAKQIYMVIYNDYWNDIGSFKSIHDILPKDNNDINSDSNYLSINSSNCLIKSDKLILLNNVSNLSIIDSNDIILVSDNNKSQEVKKLFELALQLNKKEIKFNNIDYRPWGSFEILAGGDNMGFKIKKIYVYPNKKLSLQSHKFRKEYWFNLNGTGIAQVENEFINLDNNLVVFIDNNKKHRLINNTNFNLEIIEIQFGSYLGEDDIIRYEDDYNRL